jgi:hypothetical protein
MPDPKKMLGAFFGNLIQGIGKKRYQDYLKSEQERLGEKQVNQKRADELISTSLQKALDPNTPYMERIQWMKLYQGHTGVKLPTPNPVGAPETQQQKKPGDLYDFFETADIGQQQDFLQRSAERQKTLQAADANKALAEQRRRPDSGGGGTGKADLGPDKLKLDQLKTQFNQLNAQYDDLAKLIPRDIYGNPTVEADDPRVKELQRIDQERNRAYNEIYGGSKKTIQGF